MENELKINEDMTLSDDELIHWGVRGMRWGIRRYQNKDGSLTPRGQKRYNEELKKVRAEEKVLKTRQATKAKLDRLEARKKAAADKKKELDDEEAAAKGKRKKDSDDKSGKAGKRSVKDMDDAELATALNRARMEDAYLQLRPEQAAKTNGFVKDFITKSVGPAAMEAGKTLAKDYLLKLGKKKLGIEGVNTEDYDAALEKTVKRLKNEDLYRTYKQKEADALAKASEKASAKKAEKEAKKAEKEAKKAAEQSRKDALDAAKEVREDNKQPIKVRVKVKDQSKVTSGKSYVDKTSNTKVNDYRTPTKQEWDDFVREYAWGREEYAVDEVDY